MGGRLVAASRGDLGERQRSRLQKPFCLPQAQGRDLLENRPSRRRLDVAVEPLDVPAVVAPPKVSLSVRPTPLETGYRPVEKARSSPGWISWQREAARFGMLTEPHPLVGYDANSPLGRFCQAHPEWRDLYFDLGHYLAYDSGTPLAAEILGESFRHYFGHTFPNSGTDYCELAREPGVENCNARMRTGFRAFARWPRTTWRAIRP